MPSTEFVITPELREGVTRFFQRIPFNQFVGSELVDLTTEQVTMN